MWFQTKLKDARRLSAPPGKTLAARAELRLTSEALRPRLVKYPSVLSLLRKPSEWPVRSGDGRLLIRPLRTYDLLEIAAWLEDPQILRLAFGTEQDDQTVLRLGKIYLAEMDAARSSMLGILDPKERLIGFVRFAFFQGDLGRNARIGILLGKKESWNQGLGTSAVQLTLYFLFERKGCRRIELDTAEFNARAQRCFRKCGFEIIPREKRQPWMESSDSTPKVWMELTRTRWRELNAPRSH